MTETTINIGAQDRMILDKIETLFAASGKKVYLVGGYIRNCLLSLPPSDMDIASSLLPEEVLHLAGDQGDIRARIVNLRLGTVEFCVSGRKIEHTTFRKESYGGDGFHTPRDVHIGVGLEEDAKRRDFSVNALYYELTERKVLDPTGRGREDICRRRLRAAVENPEDMIKDDALRLLRMVRQACELGFTIQKQLFCAAKKHVRNIHAISKERIGVEMDKILLSDTGYGLPQKVPAPLRAVLYLSALGLLEELIPEFAGAQDIGKCKYHKYNVYLHTARTVAYTPPDKILRYAALFHDVGKPNVWKTTGKMHEHDKLGAQIVQERLPALGVDKNTVREVALLVREHMYDLDGRTREGKVRGKAQTLGYETFYRLAALKEADVLGSGWAQRPVWTAEKFRLIAAKMQAEHTPMKLTDLDIRGTDLMERLGVRGKMVGELLAALLRECAANPSLNEKEKLLRVAGGRLKNLRKNASNSMIK